MSPDDPLFAEFLAEATEHLDALETGLGGQADVDAMFRAMHSLKGMAGAVGARGMGALTHRAEDLLGQARAGRLALTGDMLAALLAAVDALRQIRDALSEGRDLAPDPALLRQLGEGEAPPVPTLPPVASDAHPLRATLASRLAAEMPGLDAAQVPALAAAARDAGLPRLAEGLLASGSPAGFGRLRATLALLEELTGVPAGAAVIRPGRAEPAALLAALDAADPAILGEAAREHADAAHGHGDAAGEALARQIQDLARRGDAVLLAAARVAFRAALAAPRPAPLPMAVGPPPPPLTPSLAAALPAAAHLRAAAALGAGLRIWRLRLGPLASAEPALEAFLARAGTSLATAGPVEAINLFLASSLAPQELATLRAEADPDGTALLDLAAADAPPPAPMLRVRQDRIDAVIDLEAGLRAANLALLEALAEPRAAQALDELGQLQHALPAAAAARAAFILERLRAARGAAERAAQRLTLGLSQLDDAVLELRVVPFEQVALRLPRTLRDLAQRYGKPAELVVSGGEVTLDRSLAELLADPLLHLLRNAVDHGIELPAERAAAGKPVTARLTLHAERAAGRLRVTFADDGGGVDLGAVEARARSRGLLPPGPLHGEARLLALLFLPGFSTRDTVSETSGRGVGLDVVQDAVRRAGGTVELSSDAGRGSRFVLDLPLNTSIQRVLLVEAAGHAYALPAARVDSVIEPTQLREGQRVLSLEALLQLPETPPGAIVLLRRPAGLLGLAVSRVGRRIDLLLRPLHPALAATPGVGGAGVLGNGEAVLLLEPDGLD